MSAASFNHRRARKWHLLAEIIRLSVCLCVWFEVRQSGRAEESMSESQVKALCLYNFAKYVEWPASAFPDSSTPITIGVLGTDALAETLRSVVKGKVLNGRPLAIQSLRTQEESRKCHVLFVSSAENKRLEEILRPIKSSPVLTVGEGGQFGQAGGMISFVVRGGKVRFEIDLGAANQTGLQISSKLLNLADAVHGKPPMSR
ncbi:conserved hypothetical protein [Verrucomicrobia bacterium]|nr:conserved hypothetical protein [Verrucomicrobiota bacterium]